MSVTAIVVNYNAGEALQRCVQSLLALTPRPRVIIVDNRSDDGSATRLMNIYGHHAGPEFIFNSENCGFARAINQVARTATDPKLLIINPDCTIQKGALQLMLKALDDEPAAALVAPSVLTPAGTLERAALRRFPDPWNSFVTITGLSKLGRWFRGFEGITVAQESITRPVTRAEAVSGACMLIETERFREIGLMDERYQLHCEDLDLMYRFHQAGYEVLLVPDAIAVHEQGVSSSSRPFWVHQQKHKGMARFFRKFQAEHTPLPVRWLVYAGIWLHFILWLPLVWLRK